MPGQSAPGRTGGVQEIAVYLDTVDPSGLEFVAEELDEAPMERPGMVRGVVVADD